MCFHKLSWILISSIFFMQINFNLTQESEPKPTPFQDWDYLVYSQRWPVTACALWEERSDQNKCDLPPDPTLWTVHGIWPTKIGKDGPFFCDSAVVFDPTQLQPMMDDLKSRWTNIEDNTKANSFWKHEWAKHGTCSVVLPELDSVYNFFRKGLDLNVQYSISSMLANSQIIPNSKGYSAEAMHAAIKSVTNKNPSIDCSVDGTTKESLINEIRICFDKNFDVIDCDVTNKTELSNCSSKKPVMYYGSTNSTASDAYMQMCLESNKYQNSLFNWYHLFKFLIWFSL